MFFQLAGDRHVSDGFSSVPRSTFGDNRHSAVWLSSQKHDKHLTQIWSAKHFISEFWSFLTDQSGVCNSRRWF